ncbi:mitochondrial import inner membrane translocase subunit TIM50-like isoform X2 [Salvia miltiorrhiza]|uniref:mitochondrial import inner membrane translocase subunit TIM50-like isoform X2 n=1 Tax=Salvia miltiorrhiza TaxID=226208 RepID=UPI0025ABE4D6|nr:mitochondrial import inner membrane translocase subunit TIM50-like isoform X2 [Salvia miltiorrhiza]
MSALLRSSSRLFSTISRRNSGLSSNFASESPKPTMISSAILGDQPPPSEDLPPLREPEAVKSSWSFLKYGIIAALTGTAATAGYATYAYSLDEIDENSKALRASTNVTIGDDVNSSDKYKAYLRAAAMTGLSKLVEGYLDLRRLTEEHVKGFTEPISDKLLPDLHPLEKHIFTLVLDLNETLIYSEWKRDRGWRTFKRPGVDEFLEHLAQFYEIVVYSDQLITYVDPVAERLDPKNCIRYRLSRVATRYIDGKHYRDLSMLNRDPAKVLYISGHALETSLQPENCVPIKEWQGEAEDTALLDLIPFLEYVARHQPADIRTVLASYQGRDISKEFIERSKELQRRMQEQKQHGRPWRLR